MKEDQADIQQRQLSRPGTTQCQCARILDQKFQNLDKAFSKRTVTEQQAVYTVSKKKLVSKYTASLRHIARREFELDSLYLNLQDQRNGELYRCMDRISKWRQGME